MSKKTKKYKNFEHFYYFLPKRVIYFKIISEQTTKIFIICLNFAHQGFSKLIMFTMSNILQIQRSSNLSIVFFCKSCSLWTWEINDLVSRKLTINKKNYKNCVEFK